MRKALFVIGLLAATGLTGCDWWDKPAPQPVVVTCQCAPPLRGSNDVWVKKVTRINPVPDRHYADSGHGYRRHDSYAERSVDTYGYSSESRGYGEGYGRGESYGEAGERSRASARAWEDGYGRRHLYDAGEANYYSDQSYQRIAETPARLDPWHGYDDDWE